MCTVPRTGLTDDELDEDVRYSDDDEDDDGLELEDEDDDSIWLDDEDSIWLDDEDDSAGSELDDDSDGSELDNDDEIHAPVLLLLLLDDDKVTFAAMLSFAGRCICPTMPSTRPAANSANTSAKAFANGSSVLLADSACDESVSFRLR